MSSLPIFNMNLSKIDFKASLNPNDRWVNNNKYYERYTVKGFLENELVGRLNITRATHCDKKNYEDFYFEFKDRMYIPKPYISWQSTEENYRGQGINGHLITLANEFYCKAFDSPLYSDIHFIKNTRKSTKRVWKKLEKNGLAIFEPYKNETTKELQDRWKMIVINN